MPKQHLENLISTLHENFGDDLTSPQQQQLMTSMRNYLHNLDEAAPAEPTLRETAELLLEDIEEQHPKAAGILREVLEALGNMGI